MTQTAKMQMADCPNSGASCGGTKRHRLGSKQYNLCLSYAQMGSNYDFSDGPARPHASTSGVAVVPPANQAGPGPRFELMRGSYVVYGRFFGLSECFSDDFSPYQVSDELYLHLADADPEEVLTELVNAMNPMGFQPYRERDGSLRLFLSNGGEEPYGSFEAFVKRESLVKFQEECERHGVSMDWMEGDKDGRGASVTLVAPNGDCTSAAGVLHMMISRMDDRIWDQNKELLGSNGDAMADDLRELRIQRENEAVDKYLREKLGIVIEDKEELTKLVETASTYARHAADGDPGEDGEFQEDHELFDQWRPWACQIADGSEADVKMAATDLGYLKKE